jgi:hypothetical protein
MGVKERKQELAQARAVAPHSRKIWEGKDFINA